MRTLDSLPARARALLGAPSRSSPVVLRLVELGMTPGTPVLVVRRAPFGEPIEVELRGTRLCLRRADAAAFGVTDVTDATDDIAEGR
jgi:Fe2+ transport system protein FeoA